MRFCLLLADVDNTLFDFRSAERAAFAAVSARFALPEDPSVFARYQAINKRLWQKLDRGETTSAQLRLDRFREFAAELGLAAGTVQAMSDLYVQTLGLQNLPVPGAEDFLRRVSAAMPVCLVTNGFADVQRPRVDASPLNRYISGHFISEEYAHPKPHPEMLLAAMAQMRVCDPARAVMIGDNENTDILAAKNAGVPAVLFTNGGPPPERTSAALVAATLAEAADFILQP